MADSADPQESPAPTMLPTGLAGLSEEQRAALAQRQAREQQENTLQTQLQQQMLNQVRSGLGVAKTMCWFMFLRTICVLAFSVMMFKKLGLGEQISWLFVFIPMLLAGSIRICGSIFMMIPQIRNRLAGQESTLIIQINHAIDGAAWVIFYYLLVQFLEGNDPHSMVGGVLVPLWVSMTLSTLLVTLFYRPLVPANEMNTAQSEAAAMGQEVRKTGSDMFWKSVNEHMLLLVFAVMVGRKVDGSVQYTWSYAFLVVYFVLAVFFFFICCFGTMLCTSIPGDNCVPASMNVVLCCCVLPTVILFTIFVAWLVERLNHPHDTAHSLRVTLGLLVAAEVLTTLLLLVACLVAHVFLSDVLFEAQQEQQQQEQEPADLEAAAENAQAERKEQNENLLQQHEKKVRLVRQTSTFFKRMASRQLGVDLDAMASDYTPSATPSANGSTSATIGSGGAGSSRMDLSLTLGQPAVEIVKTRGSGGGGRASIGGKDEGLENGDSSSNNSSNSSTPRESAGFGGKVCSICLEGRRDAVLQPCGHGGFCYDCAKTLVSTQSPCPLCRARIEEALRFDLESSGTTYIDKQTGKKVKVVVSTESAALPADIAGSSGGNLSRSRTQTRPSSSNSAATSGVDVEGV